MIYLHPIYIAIACLWFVSVSIDYARFLYIWQLKEYRIDLMRDFFSTKKGQDFWKSYPLATRAVLTIGLYVFLREIFPTANVILTIFALDVACNIYLLYKKIRRRPILTKKVLLITGIALLVEASIVMYLKSWQLFLLFLAFRFLFLSAIIVCFSYPTTIIKKWYIFKAKRKLSAYKDLKVIGITGSYGKTTTKTYLAQILGKKYHVVTPTKNINTDIGVAKHILSTNFTGVDIYIVEMGAYKKGEIKIIADMVCPIVGILTAINEEHLSLFGTLENTTNTKYELLRAIPENGLVITNADNIHAMKYIHELKAPVQTFGLDEDNTPHILITNATNKKEDGILIEGTDQKHTFSYHIKNIHGSHNSTNIAACIIAAKYFNLTNEEIKTQVEQLTPPKDRLNICKYGDATIINDSYNANPDGFRAALDVLGSFPSHKKRIVITRGMTELGEQSEQLHKNIAEEISFYADTLIVISKDSYEALAKGILKKYQITIELIENHEQLLTYLQSLKEQNVVILLENRMPSIIYKELEREQHACQTT
ncbi:MAG: UDP-N-acetylmuramoyl-tripeptide--D-alanyl-D-alanine ligase [Candidatus Magasanikbacteria bacterium]|uniref:UDP-N-acetylmuramoyl-tripeptide--D-alanyl-D-alanine ligase n=1 Tax=Candidatus Magasanikbacteria bacterium CG10_big_fil_rev_8_21_14_0_10_38_6 TaxID=1974647 RepID=A0A2M6P1Q9_9BACT|nr:UDP-N-acetylmuramoyl-tripeptide--D-alanyl-D-alanine ligase [Candidatus Magasanikbacteria bacterium]NCS72216.1 UDP-N-acetylmuramoyl-tripeptide--D-alanyl-D-alanine ligase [Candidatus Magasanikbacteria bacterium]PIR77656.1 MAG: hypothetical protein COU30_01235 [Candidatus Magasanikbacteria bacterium CG10_big_fil_rev_8_21_14_0_10_38_6]